MAQPPKATILDHFAELDDPRVECTRRRKLVDIPAVAICGADYALAVSAARLPWLTPDVIMAYGSTA